VLHHEDSLLSEKSRDQVSFRIGIAKLEFIDLARRASGDVIENRLTGSFVTWEMLVEKENHFFCCEFFSRNWLDDRTHRLTESLIGYPDDGNVTYFRVTPDHVFDLNGVDILTARNDQILLSVHDVDEYRGVRDSGR